MSVPQGYLDQIKRTEALCATLRRRNGELIEALEQADPERAKALSFPGIHHGRYLAAERIIDRAIALVHHAVDAEHWDEIEGDIDLLRESVTEHESRWQVGNDTTKETSK
jgi:hypothetical protein